MYKGSRFSSPYCPGISVYEDDTDSGGKICKRPSYTGEPGISVKFKINKNGDCDEDDHKKCATDVSKSAKDLFKKNRDGKCKCEQCQKDRMSGSEYCIYHRVDGCIGKDKYY
jgi:hypothetical protein